MLCVMPLHNLQLYNESEYACWLSVERWLLDKKLAFVGTYCGKSFSWTPKKLTNNDAFAPLFAPFAQTNH
jgi:hypothetical protein